MRDTIDMAREAKCGTPSLDGKNWSLWPNVEQLVELVRADERDRAVRENAYVQAEREAQATARIAITHLQEVLNKARTHADQQAADTAARDWLISIGSDPT